MEAEDRRIVETRFQREDGLIVVATVAFGMGIDKPDIRWVAHADLPKSVEAYYQEIGRAGRDGAPADTLTLFGADDIRFRRQQIDEGLAPPEMRHADHGRLNALLGLAEAQVCRRVTLLAFFGEEAAPCGNCDLCTTPPELWDATTEVRKALSAMLRTDERFGTGHLIDVLTGTETDKTRRFGHESLPTWGAGRDVPKPQWQAIFRQMMGLDLVRPDPERHGALRFMEAALPVLRGEAPVTLRRDSVVRAERRPAVKQLVSEEDAPLLSALKAKRRALAEAQGVPAYVVATDKTLIEIAETRPRDLDAMARISGIGAAKLERYGAAFIEVVTGAGPAPVHPSRRRLAGRPEGDVFDRLMAAQAALIRGPEGTDKPMSCPSAHLAKVAKAPPDATAVERIIGPRHMARFGEAFLEVLRDAE
jgi:ATP-dependent DNA helicase RecQ